MHNHRPKKARQGLLVSGPMKPSPPLSTVPRRGLEKTGRNSCLTPLAGKQRPYFLINAFFFSITKLTNNSWLRSIGRRPRILDCNGC